MHFSHIENVYMIKQLYLNSSKAHKCHNNDLESERKTPYM